MVGANYLTFNRYVPVGTDNGLLTAYEILTMDFRNTDLVVLHDLTGLGDPSLSSGHVDSSKPSVSLVRGRCL